MPTFSKQEVATMARKSRKNVQSFELEREIRVWKTAVYARLSRSRKELESIETQIEEVKNYIKIRPYFKFVDVYADDGYTGTDFKRPEFLRLMEDLRNRKIDCIIVRDLSRFARNHIEADEYLCNIFPFLGVRFIAIMDSYDNINVKPKEYFLTSFKNFAHAYFAMETSRKVCTAKRNLQEQGKFIGSRPPLGYRKDPADKHKLIVDEEKAPIIREIFERYADGEAIGDIASDFNRRSLKTVENFEWDYSAIHAILQKEAYLGTLIQRTTVKAFYKCQETTRIPKDEQLRFENAFPPIISRELWERVRQIQASPKVYPTFAPVCKNVYKFLVYCGHCKHNISGRNQKRKSKPTYLSYSCRYCKPAVSATAELIDTAVRNHLKLPTDTEISRDLVLQNFRAIFIFSRDNIVLCEKGGEST
jgi:DNA invertase Pin-like site-specific DNA recombinase